MLFVAGLIYNGLKSDGVNLSNWVITSPLSIYAFLVLFIHGLALVLKSARAWALFSLGLSVAWSIALRLFAQGCPGGAMSAECNPSWPVDHGLMGVHMQSNGATGYDPVGFVALVGALVNVAIGVTLAHITAENRTKPARLLVRASGWTAAVLVAGFLLEWVIPSSKAIWTPPYSLLAGSIGLVLFVAAIAVFDFSPMRRARTIATPLVALGRNSLLVYFGSHLLMAMLNRSPSSVEGRSMAIAVAERADLLGNPQISLVLAMLAFWWVLSIVMHWFKIYVRA